ncbi:DUF5677 domain-containing protein [Aliifodinibius salicampi]|uniref:DUF5677 domain-containing protein n=1 Tax=Fodinibius salicampi TaxID=1920655 RepID=A0ABT3PXC1_9BACT|nr:DUF5677 domain-containing protein [Fodinibius salicampi]MCW9712441.1 DUF5677 domain-containing protein [Fodinibius salicampi]
MQSKIPEKEIFECLKNIVAVAPMLIFDLAEKTEKSKDFYLRNCIAKGSSLLESILILYKKEYYDNALILYRSLLDRLVHVYYLSKHDSFQEFKFETLTANFEHVNNARSDQSLEGILEDPLFQITKEEWKKYQEYKQNLDGWNKPDPKKILKENDLGFLYKFGYEYASRRVHPTYFDGYPEFHTITKLEPNPYDKFDNQTIINNSVLITSVLFSECLTKSSFSFRQIVFDYFKSIHNLLHDDSDKDYKNKFVKIAKLFNQEVELSK